MHGGDRLCVVGGELREESGRVRKQQPHAGEIGNVRVTLAREDGIVGEPPLLRPLDLAVPVGALDEAHGDALAAHARRSCLQPAQHRDGTLAVGLHGEAEPRPAVERGIEEGGGEQVEREIEPILLLGIDGEAEAVLPRGHGELDEPRQQLARSRSSLPGSKRGWMAESLTEMPGRSNQRLRVTRIGRRGLPMASMASR